MSLSYELQSPSKGQKNVVVSNEKEYTFDYPCPYLHDCTPYIVTFPPGNYTFETWGAQGGSYSNNNGGRGGYSKGTILFKDSTIGYLYIGGQGTATNVDGKQNGGYNGGGYGQCDTAQSKGAGGGGGTDIRLISDSLYHRVIVSGGGGGSGYGCPNSCYTHLSGGYGGGEKGEDTKIQYNSPQYSGGGGTQTDPGFTPSFNNYVIPASFGSGGSFTRHGGNYDSPGGGGGWFGGAASGDNGLGAAGGSGYILTETSYKPPGYKLTSEYFMTSISSSNGQRSGNGMIRITVNDLSKNMRDKCKMFYTNIYIYPILPDKFIILCILSDSFP